MKPADILIKHMHNTPIRSQAKHVAVMHYIAITADPTPDNCNVCGEPCEKNGWGQTGGDGFNDRCCGVMDHPTIENCENCGAAYLEGERVPEYDEEAA